MLTFGQYIRAKSLDEAYELCQKKSNIVLGGMVWLKMQTRNAGAVIDLCDLGLDTIEETDSEWRIGAMVSLRTLETHPALNALTQGALAESVRHIVGVQFRNTATLGGSLYGRFGFSDVLTLFMALGAKVELHHAGILPIEEFAELPRKTRDILVRVIVPKAPRRIVYLSQRNISTDFPVLTCAIARCEGQYTCVIGARPHKARIFAGPALPVSGITAEEARAYADAIAEQADCGGNLRGSAEYRTEICKVLVRRALLALDKED